MKFRHRKPGLRVTDDELRALVDHEVIKREVLSSEQGLEAWNRQDTQTCGLVRREEVK